VIDGTKYGLDHAQTLAVVLPAMGVRRKSKRAKVLKYAERVWKHHARHRRRAHHRGDRCDPRISLRF